MNNKPMAYTGFFQAKNLAILYIMSLEVIKSFTDTMC
jgi:hypothetical protein